MPTFGRSTRPVANQELWRLDPGQSAGIAALAIQGKYLYGMSPGGTN